MILTALDRLFVAVQIFEKLELAYDRHTERKRRAREDEKDRKIRELEGRLEALEARAKETT